MQAAYRCLPSRASNLTLFATLLDRPGNHCLANMIAAVPDTPKAQDALREFQAFRCLKQIKRCQAEIRVSLH